MQSQSLSLSEATDWSREIRKEVIQRGKEREETRKAKS